MKALKTFLYAVIGGMCISIGGCAFLASESKAVGAVFFVVGLFTICTFGFNLFTGKVCYSLDNRPRYILDLILIWIGNLVGCLVLGGLLRLTRLTAFMEKANSVCDAKLGDNLLSIFILAIFCNILIYIAVDGYKNNPHEIGKYLALFFGVTVFVLCGFEHCVANMFYITAAGRWSGQAILFLIVNTLGNAVGGLLIPVLKKMAGREKQAAPVVNPVSEPKEAKETAEKEPKIRNSEISKNNVIEQAGQNRDTGNYKDIVFTSEDYRGIEIQAAGSRDHVTDRLIDKIAQRKGITYPESLIESETRDLVTGYLQRRKYKAMGSGNIMDMQNIDMEAVEAEARAQAIHDLNEETVLKGIITAEAISVTPEELQQEALRISGEQNTDMEMVKRFFGEDFSGLAKDVQKRKARELIYDTAKLTK